MAFFSYPKAILSYFVLFLAIKSLCSNLPTINVEDIAPDFRSMICEGVIVLGMGRSGTSLLTGILSKGCGYVTGDNLILPREYNSKGYFERVDVVRQNMEFLKQQGVKHMGAPSTIRGYRAATRNDTSSLTRDGRSAVEFFNNSTSIPWIQKDPRMCVTLKEWLPLMDTEPAILITYRHPLEVSQSLFNRGRMPLSKGIASWTVYNEVLLRNSAGMCRVVTTNSDIMRNPVQEVSRIAQELTVKCGVLPPPHLNPSKSIVSDFVDESMQKSKKEHLPTCNETLKSTDIGLRNERPTEEDRRRKYDIAMEGYTQAMKLYCDMQSGRAFADDYKF